MNDILFGNSNRPVIKKLSNRYFKAGKSRNIIAIIAIALTTILFTTIFTLGSGLIDTVHDQNIRKQGGDGQAVLNYISDEVFDNIKGNEMIEQIAYTKAVSYHINNPGLEKWRADMWFMDDTALKFARYEPTTGHRPEAENGVTSNYNKDAEGNPLVQLYGADDFLLNSMDVIEGTIDWEALKSGNYVLYALTADDNGNIIDDPNIHVGDTLHFNHVQMNGLSSSIDNNFDCKVMAKVLINENTDTIRSTGFAKFYMPTDVFLPLCEQPHLVSFPFNVVDGMEADMEEFLSSYVEDIEPSMNYDSKQTYINSFNDLTSLIITIGGALSIIIGLIGITNFVNSVLTSIITRRKELAMLQSIGMTGKQLKKMLSFEGLYYAAGTVVASIVFGSLVSVIIVRAISNSIWFFTYKFVIFPMFVIYPFLIALTVIIPAIIYRKIAKTSIIERLHQN